MCISYRRTITTTTNFLLSLLTLVLLLLVFLYEIIIFSWPARPAPSESVQRLVMLEALLVVNYVLLLGSKRPPIPTK